MYIPEVVSGVEGKGKGKANPIQAWRGPEVFRRFRLAEFKHIRHMKVVILSVLRTGRFYAPRKYS